MSYNTDFNESEANRYREDLGKQPTRARMEELVRVNGILAKSCSQTHKELCEALNSLIDEKRFVTKLQTANTLYRGLCIILGCGLVGAFSLLLGGTRVG